MEKALALVLDPQNAKYITYEALRRVKDHLPNRGRMASDWFNDRVAEAYAEFNENKPRGKIVNDAEIPENKELLARIKAVLDAKAIVGGNKVELENCQYWLQRRRLDHEETRLLEMMLKEGEAKMKTQATPALNDGTLVHNKLFLVNKIEELLGKIGGADLRKASGSENFILCESDRSLKGYRRDLLGGIDHKDLPKYVERFNAIDNGLRQILGEVARPAAAHMTIAQLNERIEILADAISKASEEVRNALDNGPLNTPEASVFKEFDSLIIQSISKMNRLSPDNSPAPQESIEAIEKIEKDARKLLEKHGLPLATGEWVQTGTPESYYNRVLAVLDAGVMDYHGKIELAIFRNQLGAGSFPSYGRLKQLNELLAEGEGLMREAGAQNASQPEKITSYVQLANKIESLMEAIAHAELNCNILGWDGLVPANAALIRLEAKIIGENNYGLLDERVREFEKIEKGALPLLQKYNEEYEPAFQQDARPSTLEGWQELHRRMTRVYGFISEENKEWVSGNHMKVSHGDLSIEGHARLMEIIGAGEKRMEEVSRTDYHGRW